MNIVCQGAAPPTRGKLLEILASAERRKWWWGSEGPNKSWEAWGMSQHSGENMTTVVTNYGDVCLDRDPSHHTSWLLIWDNYRGQGYFMRSPTMLPCVSLLTLPFTSPSMSSGFKLSPSESCQVSRSQWWKMRSISQGTSITTHVDKCNPLRKLLFKEFSLVSRIIISGANPQ